jgi:hypothetical protein
MDKLQEIPCVSAALASYRINNLPFVFYEMRELSIVPERGGYLTMRISLSTSHMYVELLETNQ